MKKGPDRPSFWPAKGFGHHAFDVPPFFPTAVTPNNPLQTKFTYILEINIIFIYKDNIILIENKYIDRKIIVLY